MNEREEEGRGGGWRMEGREGESGRGLESGREREGEEKDGKVRGGKVWEVVGREGGEKEEGVGERMGWEGKRKGGRGRASGREKAREKKKA